MAKLTMGDLTVEGTAEELRDFIHSFNDDEGSEKVNDSPCEDIEDSVEDVEEGYVTEKRRAEVGESILLTEPWNKRLKGRVFKVSEVGGPVSLHVAVVEGVQENFLESEYEVIVGEDSVNAKYVTEKRRAVEGESILLTNPYVPHMKGEVEVVKSTRPSLIPNESVAEVERGHTVFFEKEYEVIVGSKEDICEGDAVVILGKSHSASRGCTNDVGDIGLVVGRGVFSEESVKIKVEGNYSISVYTHESEVRIATDAEKTFLEESTKCAKDVKVGDIVRCLRSNEIGVVTVADGTPQPHVQLSTKLYWAYGGVELIARAEDRLDVEQS